MISSNSGDQEFSSSWIALLSRVSHALSPDKSGDLNRSMQHHLIQICFRKVVLYETWETVWAFCDREERHLEPMEGGTVAA
jgi:hypothetical protein